MADERDPRAMEDKRREEREEARAEGVVAGKEYPNSVRTGDKVNIPATVIGVSSERPFPEVTLEIYSGLGRMPIRLQLQGVALEIVSSEPVQ